MFTAEVMAKQNNERGSAQSTVEGVVSPELAAAVVVAEALEGKSFGSEEATPGEGAADIALIFRGQQSPPANSSVLAELGYDGP